MTRHKEVRWPEPSSCPLNTRLATGVDLSFFLSFFLSLTLMAMRTPAAWQMRLACSTLPLPAITMPVCQPLCRPTTCTPATRQQRERLASLHCSFGALTGAGAPGAASSCAPGTPPRAARRCRRGPCSPSSACTPRSCWAPTGCARPHSSAAQPKRRWHAQQLDHEAEARRIAPHVPLHSATHGAAGATAEAGRDVRHGAPRPSTMGRTCRLSTTSALTLKGSLTGCQPAASPSGPGFSTSSVALTAGRVSRGVARWPCVLGGGRDGCNAEGGGGRAGCGSAAAYRSAAARSRTSLRDEGHHATTLAAAVCTYNHESGLGAARRVSTRAGGR
jgi:hypothetical protein